MRGWYNDVYIARRTYICAIRTIDIELPTRPRGQRSNIRCHEPVVVCWIVNYSKKMPLKCAAIGCISKSENVERASSGTSFHKWVENILSSAPGTRVSTSAVLFSRFHETIAKLEVRFRPFSDWQTGMTSTLLISTNMRRDRIYLRLYGGACSVKLEQINAIASWTRSS